MKKPTITKDEIWTDLEVNPDAWGGITAGLTPTQVRSILGEEYKETPAQEALLSSVVQRVLGFDAYDIDSTYNTDKGWFVNFY